MLAADVAGYTRLMERAEDETHRRLMQINQRIILATLAEHDGTLVKHTGDGFLATFRSAVSAAHCGLAIQERTAAANSDVPASDAILFRMGLNLADVIIEEHDDIACCMLDASVAGTGQALLEFVGNHLMVWILSREAIT